MTWFVGECAGFVLIEGQVALACYHTHLLEVLAQGAFHLIAYHSTT